MGVQNHITSQPTLAIDATSCSLNPKSQEQHLVCLKLTDEKLRTETWKKVQREVIFVFLTGLKSFKRCTKAHTQEAFQRLE